MPRIASGTAGSLAVCSAYDNPALMNLRLLQTIAQDAGVPGTTRFVVNLPERPAPA
jgi:hypothetical protein